ncbi:MAG: Gfo/Idh/MocA family oxidoreductase [Bacillota bacterium]|nr:Gfo/Idh/MocA family oxidoreductase [Bacillota bacterium]
MDKLKVALFGLDHVHASQMFSCMNLEADKIEWIGAADFLSSDPVVVDEKVKRNLNKDSRDANKIYYDYNELLDLKPDIVLINSDVKSHADIAEVALRRGLCTVIEKPMAFDMQDAKRMYRAAKKSSGELIINWPIAWFPAFNKAKELADSKIVGKVLRVQYRSPSTRGPYRLGQYTAQELSNMWWYQHDRGGGSIMDYAGYGCVLTTWITGLTAKRVSGMKKNFFLPFSDVEDYSTFTLDFGEKIGLIEGSWSTMNNGEIATGPVIYGSEGVIVADRFDPVVKVYKDLKPYQPSPTPTEVFQTEGQNNRDMAINIINHIEKGVPLHELLTLDFNMKAMTALDAGIRSCESGNIENTIEPFGL